MDPDLAERLLPLEGGVNFRDMGGYRTADGRRTKWRQLFRSGQLSRLGPADRSHLANLGIRTVIDLRTATEQEHEPSAWVQELGARYWSRNHNERFGNLYELAGRGIASVEEAQEIMRSGFREVPFQQAEAYAELFRTLAGGEVPVVFHCTAGKDRTGGAAALVLAALGVPREVIAHDFAMTERAVDLRTALRVPGRQQSMSVFAALPPDISAAIRGAHPGYIAALLDGIDQRFGSVEGYLGDLGLSPSDLMAMRANLLETD